MKSARISDSIASPYPGLRPFQPQEAPIFFGRAEQTEGMLEKLEDHHFLAVVGTSGCGKSSLVRVGLLPALEEGYLLGAGEGWRVALMTPGDAPFVHLARALTGASALGPERGTDERAAAFVEATLRRGPLGLVELIRETLDLPEGISLLLLVDQFEEIFRYRGQFSLDDADAFVNLLLASTQHSLNTEPGERDASIYVVLTMRSDFLGDCALLTGLPEAMNESQFLTPRLTRDQYREAILEPARVFGGDLEPALVNRMLNDMKGVPDQLPVVQHVLMRMWTQGASTDSPTSLTLEDYETAGGLSSALSRHADKALAELAPDQQRIAESMFRSLCERGADQRDVRRPVKVSEAAEVAGCKIHDLEPVVEAFRHPGRCFLMPAETPLDGDTVLDISHESLIRQWGRLNEWVEAETASAEKYVRLEDAARRWEAGEAAPLREPDLDIALQWRATEGPTASWASRYGGDFGCAMKFIQASERDREQRRREAEKARQREEAVGRLRSVVWVVSLAFLIASVLATLALMQRQRAEEALEMSQANEAKARTAETEARQAELRETAAKDALAAALKGAQESEAKAKQAAEEARESETRAKEAAQQEKRTRGDLEVALEKAQESEKRATRAAEEEKKATESLAAALKRAQASEDRANSAEDLRARELFESQLTHASLLARVEDYAAAREVLGKTYALDPKVLAERRHSRNLMSWFVDLMGAGPVQTYMGADVPLLDVAASPDGRMLAAVGEKGIVCLFDAADGRMLKRWQRSGTVDGLPTDVVFHPNGEWLITAAPRGGVVRWSLPDAKKLGEFTASRWVLALAVSPDGNFLAVGNGAGEIVLMDPETGKLLHVLEGHGGSILDIAFSPGGRLLASASHDGTAKIWGLETERNWLFRRRETWSELQTLRGPAAEVLDVAFHPDGEILATSGDASVRLWSVGSGDPILVLRGHRSIVSALTFVDEGRRLVTASRDSTVRVWDTDSGSQLRTLQGHRTRVGGVAAHGKDLFSASGDGTVRRWRAHLQSSQPTMRVVSIPGRPYSVAIAPDGACVALGLWPGLRVYSLPDAGLLWAKAKAHTGAICRVAFSPDGKRLASADLDRRTIVEDGGVFRMESTRGENVARVWRASDGEPEATFAGHAASVNALAFAPDGKSLATASSDGKVGLFKLGEPGGRFHSVHDQAQSVAFDAHGKRLLTAGADGATRMWDLGSWPPAELTAFPKSDDQVGWATFSLDGARVATVGGSQSVHVFSVDDGRELMTLAGHEGFVFRVAFSPDGGQIATVNNDATVRVWDLTARAELFSLRLPIRARTWGAFDLAFRTTPTGDCWIAVPLTRGKLVIYHLPKIYDMSAIKHAAASTPPAQNK